MHLSSISDLSIFFTIEWIIRIGSLFVVPKNRKPSAAMGWLMLIMLEPVVGLFVFLMLGSPKLSKRRRAMQGTMDQIIGIAVTEAKNTPEIQKYVHFNVPKRFQPFVSLNTNLGGLPAFSGNEFKLLPNYDENIKTITEDAHKANNIIHIEFFIITYDDVTEDLFSALADAVERGVKVRVLLDAFGSRRFPRFKQTKQKLTDIGVEWHLALPFKLPGKNFNRLDLRNHRKIIIIDNSIGYTGSQNLIRRNYHRTDALYYDELMVRMEGPIVTQLHGVFITDWYSETGEMLTRESHPDIQLTLKAAGKSLAQILPSGPGFNNDNNLKLFTGLIHAAQKRIVIVNPYFVPDDSLLLAITSAAQRGVDVVMINSEIMDQKMVGHAQRSYYEELLKAGVKIYLYDYPILLHSKFIIIDDDMAVIGSSNMDLRSFQLDLEISLVVYDPEVVAGLYNLESKYLALSKQIDLTSWSKRSRTQRLLENLTRLTASLQ